MANRADYVNLHGFGEEFREKFDLLQKNASESEYKL